MKTFKQYLEEMANCVGETHRYITATPERRKAFFNHTSKFHFESNPTNKDHIILHKKVEVGQDKAVETTYVTNDHKAKETLHRTKLADHAPTKQFPFHHTEQEAVERKEGNELPRGYAKNLFYNHFKEGKHPIISSSEQSEDGHKMWHSLTHRALDDGHHVYYHDGKKLHTTTKENIGKHLGSYFNPDQSVTTNADKHMVISKTKL